METFSALLALCEGNHRSPVFFPHKGQRRGALMFSLICAWTHRLANNRNAETPSRSSWRYRKDVTDIRLCLYIPHIDIKVVWRQIARNPTWLIWGDTTRALNMFVIHINMILASTSKQHYSDVIMGTIASQITSLTIVYLAVYSGADQRKHQSSTLLAFVRGIHRSPVISPHKGPVTRKVFPFDDVIMSDSPHMSYHSHDVYDTMLWHYVYDTMFMTLLALYRPIPFKKRQ